MSEEILSQVGLHIDVFNKLRLIQPDLADSSTQLNDEIKSFSETISAFQKEAIKTIGTLTECAEAINRVRITTMASQNTTTENAVADDVRRIQILIRERQIELDRLRIELDAARQEENDQKEYLQKLLCDA
uniref:Mediator of RNA polymerase II transcription subunit 21 n=1 Tax=Syphacia muris TaxID=451379 RepID=A0A0N5AY51_9BILA